MSGNNHRPLGKSPLADAIFENIKSQSDAFAATSKAGLEQGRAIGRREMKPLIRALAGTVTLLVAALNHLNGIDSPGTDEILSRAKEAIEND